MGTNNLITTNNKDLFAGAKILITFFWIIDDLLLEKKTEDLFFYKKFN